MFYGLSAKEQKLLKSILKMLGVMFGKIFHSDHLIAMSRCMGFFEDSRFMGSYQKAASSDQEKSLIWRLHVLAWAGEHCANIPGDFVECGVYKGFYSAFLADYLSFSSLTKTYYLYDTFSGIPDGYREGSPVSKGAYNEKGLYESVVSRFSCYPNIQVIKGIVPEIFQDICPSDLAFLHLDMNSARAEVGALNILFERVACGGIILFDDYGWYSYRAQKKAEDRFMRENDYSILELPTGQGMVIKR